MDLTVLLTSAGRRVGLVECFRASAAELGVGLRLVACELKPQLSSACALADTVVAAPRCTDPGYGAFILDLCAREGVDLVVPTIDTELRALAEIAPFAALAGTRVHVASPQVIDIVRDKQRTADVLAQAGLPVPQTVPLEACVDGSARLGWPVFIKPRAGSASRSLRVAHAHEDLPVHPDEAMVAQEFLRGDEFTINVFVDRGGTMRAAVPHQRLAVRAGEVEKGVTVRSAAFERLAARIVAALPDLRGAFCFQLIDDVRRGPTIIEINARFGGGYPLAHAAGARFTRWLLEEVGGLPTTASDAWSAGLLMLRYDAAIFSVAR